MVDDPLEDVGQRLRALRQHRGFTLTDLSERTGISVSTLSRLESGERRAALELLMPLARLYDVSLDSLVGRDAHVDPRVRGKPTSRNGHVFTPLSREAGAMTAFSVTIPLLPRGRRPELKIHPGWDWFYVVSGRVRLILGDDEYILEPGEAAEFDTLRPHGMVAEGSKPAEVLHLMNREGERVHIREL